MINKLMNSPDEAVEIVQDGATVLVGGFGGAGLPRELLDALTRRRLRDLTVVSNNAGYGDDSLSRLIGSGAVTKVVCSFPRSPDPGPFQDLYQRCQIDLELCPQGTLVERIRAAGAGLAGFYTPAGVGTALAEGKQVRTLDGRDYVFERPLPGDVALIAGRAADRWGNVVYRKAGRNFGPVMATAAGVTIVQVPEIVPLGELDPEAIVTPGIFVDRVVPIVGS